MGFKLWPQGTCGLQSLSVSLQSSPSYRLDINHILFNANAKDISFRCFLLLSMKFNCLVLTFQQILISQYQSQYIIP